MSASFDLRPAENQKGTEERCERLNPFTGSAAGMSVVFGMWDYGRE